MRKKIVIVIEKNNRHSCQKFFWIKSSMIMYIKSRNRNKKRNVSVNLGIDTSKNLK